MRMRYKHIRELRQDRDIKQIELAKILNIAQNTYSQYETGKLIFDAEMLKVLAEFYQVSVDYLLDLTDDPNSSK